jgi:hypothetical protein
MINVKQWMDLTLEVRAKIIKDFNLVRTGKAGIAGNKIVSDGYTQDDISKINLINLQKVLDSADEDFDTMFADYVDMIQKTLAVIEEPETIIENITIDMSTFTKAPEVEEVFNPLATASGDTETYFGTKIKPVTYIQKPNGKKTKRN